MSIIKQGQILRSAIDGTPLQIGQEFKLDNYRVPVTLQDATPPHRPGTSGYVYVRFPGTPQGQQDERYYTSVIDAEWAPEGSPFFSKKLRRELFDRSHAILEETDNETQSNIEGGNLVYVTLDSLSEEATKEYAKLQEIYGPDRAVAEASRHIYGF